MNNTLFYLQDLMVHLVRLLYNRGLSSNKKASYVVSVTGLIIQKKNSLISNTEEFCADHLMQS